MSRPTSINAIRAIAYARPPEGPIIALSGPGRIAYQSLVSAALLAIFAHVSFRVTVLLNTGAPGRESGSAQK